MPKEPTTAWQFAVHVVVSTALFCLIVLAAAGLDWLAAWLERQAVSSYIVLGTRVMEGVLFLADLIVFGWRLIRGAFHMLRTS